MLECKHSLVEVPGKPEVRSVLSSLCEGPRHIGQVWGEQRDDVTPV